MNKENPNNSKEMKTVVETYVVEETQELIYDDERLAEWNKYVAELGLTGQTAIVKTTKSPIPFLHMPPSLINTFKTLCPAQVSIERYSISPIPIEILSLVTLAKTEGHFEKIEIWYDDKNIDPVCVGIRHNGFYSLNQKGSFDTRFDNREDAQLSMTANGVEGKPYPVDPVHYLIGRWGDEKRSFENLKARARKRYVTEKSARYKKEIKEAERGLADVEIKADELFLADTSTDIF